MSVIVNGMNMPKNCHDCELCALTVIYVDGFGYGCRVLKQMIYDDSKRLEDCPLVEMKENDS